MMCKLKEWMDKGRHYDVEMKGWIQRGLYDVELKGWRQKGALRCAN